MKAKCALMAGERRLGLKEEQIHPADLADHEILVQAEASAASAGTELANFLAIIGLWWEKKRDPGGG